MEKKIERMVRGGRSRTGLWLVASAMALAVAGCGSGSDSSGVAPPVPLVVVEANLDAQAAKIGGATSAAALHDDGATQWAVYSMANRLAATPIGTAKGAAPEIELPGYILHIEPIVHDGTAYALVSMGGKGLAVVDLTNPAALKLLHVVDVNYEKTGLDFVDGGGNPVTGATVSGSAGTITTVTGDGADLYIGNADFGIHKTAISNLLPVPQLEADGTLVIDTEIWTLQYAGENPWGGPQSLKLHGGKLYAALGFLGIAIYDPADLGVKPGRYNLYTDESVHEDWFGARSLQASIANPAFLDPDTGMPTWEQAAWEINDFWRAGKMDTAQCANVDWCTPWASFDRYGKYYYQARTLDLVEFDPGTPGARTIAYVAYSLGGLVAVDVTDPGNAKYDGYVAAVPAHGADEPTGTQASSLFPHFGSGMLKEAGVMDVRVVADATGPGYKAYYSDHFAGLVVVGGAENPQANWKNTGSPHDNDIFPSTPYWPDYEFVTSYDMTPVTPSGSDESIPAFVAFNGGFTSPVLLASGEISGHGGVLFLMPGMDTGAPGQIDVVQATGAGGLNFIDIKGFSGTAITDYFEVPVRHVSTDEVGAAADGSATQPMAIGHAEGVTVSGNHVFLADGPHGMSAWRIADAAGVPTDDLRLVANTLQSEYPFNGILPTPHAFKVYFGAEPTRAWVMSQSLGSRRVDVSAVPAAAPGAPKLLTLTASDIFEHSTDLYTVDKKITAVNSQDHAYGVAFHGGYAVVADGGNGLTVYDTTADPAAGTSAHLVANLGGTGTGRPPLGRAAAVKLWTDPETERKYAIVAAGAYGISVVEMTDLLDRGIKPGMKLIKTFEPKKYDEDKVGSADGKSVDVHLVGDYAYFSYDSFGLVAYRIADLIQPVAEFQPVGQPADACADLDEESEVTALSAKQRRTVDCRPESVGRFKLQLVPGYETVDGGALYMTSQYFPANVLLGDGAGNTYQLDTPRTLFYVAYGAAGVVKLDWSDPANPQMMAVADTVGSAAATAIGNGRVYVADGTGGMVVFK